MSLGASPSPKVLSCALHKLGKSSIDWSLWAVKVSSVSRFPSLFWLFRSVSWSTRWSYMETYLAAMLANCMLLARLLWILLLIDFHTAIKYNHVSVGVFFSPNGFYLALFKTRKIEYIWSMTTVKVASSLTWIFGYLGSRAPRSESDFRVVRVA